MKRLIFISLLITMLLPLTTSCGKDEAEQKSEQGGNQNEQGGQSGGGNQGETSAPIIVTVDANGNANGGHRFVKIDDTNFYIDDIKYSASSGNLIVTGYNDAFFSGKATIISQLNYDGREMHVIEIGEKAFAECTVLTSVIIPSSVTSIGAVAFYSCTGLTSVTIPSSVAIIGRSAFESCTGLISVTIPSSVTCIGIWAFYGCTGLSSVHIADLVAWCKISFYDNPLLYAHHLYLNGEEIKDLVIPSSVTGIEEAAFAGCIGLTSVTIPNSVTNIGKNAFEEADIPTIISFIEKPFAIKGKTSDDRSFSLNTFNNVALYVPTGTVDKYKTTEGWMDFNHIEEFDASAECNLKATPQSNTYYKIDGKMTAAPSKGINIVRDSKGIAKKVLVK